MRETVAVACKNASRWGSVGIVVLCGLPGALTVYLAFNGGGYFPAQPALVALFLALVLVVWTTISERPHLAMSPMLGLAGGALALFALWTLASQWWSHASGRALIEFDRAFLYVLAMTLFGLVASSIRRLRWMMRGVTLAIAVVCVSALVTRLFPNLFHVGPSLASNRLSFPITYWNTLGLLASFGIILCFHLASDRREPRLIRPAAAAVLPLLAATLYFTFSRGAIAVAVVGLIVYCGLTRSRLLAVALLATGPPTVAVLVAAYHADLLASREPTTSLATAQGHRVALAAVTCALAAGFAHTLLMRLEPRLVRCEASPGLRRGARISGLGVAATLLVLAVALGVPHAVAREYDRFISGAAPGKQADLRTRLLDPSNSGRTDGWRTALRAFRHAPLHGQGAGTYQVYWERHRPTRPSIRDAHSLYFEVAAELGVVGIVLLATALAAICFGVLRRTRGPDLGVYAAAFAVFLAWCIHAGVDWDWEMPVVTAAPLMLVAAALSTHTTRPPGPIATLSGGLRLAVAIGWVVGAVTPALVTISDGQIARGASALGRGDCRTARDAAFASLRAVGSRSQAYEIVGYCDLAAGFPSRAMMAMKEAIRRDPQNWQYRDGLAVATAAAGLDPRSAAELAQRLNPRDVLPQRIRRLFEPAHSARWRADAGTARSWMLDSGRVGSR